MGGGGSIAFPLKEGYPLRGIFSALRKNNGGKLPDGVTVKVSSKSVRCFTDPVALLGPEHDGDWTSENVDNSWIEIAFASKKFELYGYTLKTFGQGKNSTHPKSWKVEVSPDGINYTQADNVKDCEALNVPNGIFSKRLQPTGQYSIIRFTMTGKNAFGSNCFTLANIELFGNLK